MSFSWLKSVWLTCIRFYQLRIIKHKKISASICLLFISTIFILSIFIGSAKAAVTITTSTSSNATAYSNQRKTWYDGTRYWAGFYSGTNIQFWYCLGSDPCSTDNTKWHQNSSATISTSTNDFSIEADSTNAFVAVANGTSVNTYRACTATGQAGCASAGAVLYPNIAFVFGTSANAINALCTTSCQYVHINRDSNNKLIVGTHHNTTTGTYTNVSTNANDNSAWGAAHSYSNVGTTDVQVMAGGLNGQQFSITKDANTQLYYRKFNSSWNDNPTFIGSTQSGVSNNMSIVSKTSTGENFLSYIDATGHVMFTKGNDSATYGTQIGSNLGSTVVGGRQVVRDSSGNIYVALVTSTSICEVWKSTNGGTSFSEVDSAHHITSCINSTAIAVAIDSTDKLHIVYSGNVGSGQTDYVTMSSDTWGTPQTSITSGGSLNSAAIAIDSNNIPHVAVGVIQSGRAIISYANRVGGSWATSIGIVNNNSGSDDYRSVDISFSNTNIPEVSYIDVFGTDGLKAAIGDANNPTTFTLTQIDTLINQTNGTFGSSMAVDSSGNTWIAYVTTNNTNRIWLAEHVAANSWSTWSKSDTIFASGSEPSIAIYGGNVHIVYGNGTATGMTTWNIATSAAGPGTTTEPSAMKTHPHVHWALNSNNGDSSPMDLISSDGTGIYYGAIETWQNQVTIDNNTTNTNVTVSYDDTNNRVYLYWLRSNTVQCAKGVAPFTSPSNWSSCAGFTGFSTGTNTLLTAMAIRNGASAAGMTWTNGSGSPFNVKYDLMNYNVPPNVPNLTAPSSGATNQTLTPTFSFNTTDSDNDDIQFTINVFQSDCTTSVTTYTESSGSGGTWSPTEDGTSGTHRYKSSTAGSGVSFTPSSNLSAGTQYCWSVSATDPAGSNVSSTSATSLFTTSASPSVPSLTSPAQPLNSSTGVALSGYSFKARAADADGDYLRYEFVVYDSNNCTGTVMEDAVEPTGTPQTNWSGQNAGPGSNTAYAGNATESSSTVAVHTYAGSTFTQNHVYSWKARAIDPGGSNTYGNYSTCASFTTNANASSPTLVSPTSTQTGLTNKPQFVLRATDPDSDYVRYQIDICSDSGCSTVLRRICNVSTSCTGAGGTQTTGQSNWTGQNQQTSSAYSSGINATYNYPFTDLAGNTTYYWRGYAIDPGGTNTWVGPTSIQSFTIGNGSISHDTLFQGKVCFGSC